jgi:GxxExxY protein
MAQLLVRRTLAERDPRTAAILGAAFEVHNTLGSGFEETIYQRAVQRELIARDLDAAREVEIEIFYKGEVIGNKRVDFIVGEVLVEIKAKSVFDPQDFVQALSYLKASGFSVGLLLNFGSQRLEYRRLVNSRATE